MSVRKYILLSFFIENISPLLSLFSVTRRSRSDVSQSVSESVTLRTKLTDVALVSEDIN